MAERKAVTRELARRYRTSSKTAKGVILNELCALTGWHRDYARRALRETAARPSHRRGTPAATRKARAPLYGEDVMVALRTVWAVLGFASGKRLQPAMEALVESLERHRELSLDADVRALLLKMSAATIDRRLAPDRKRLQIKGRTGTKPGTLLKGQIAIRTFADWDDTTPGFVQVDLVAHDGGQHVGEFAQTLTLTDVATGWTETRVLRNKAHRWVIEALDNVQVTLPFRLLGIDSDNGAEFINHALLAYCEQRSITFTRGRPYRKNDSCHVEQKNWSVVRQAVGYARFDTDAQLAELRALYTHVRAMTNFFVPQARLIGKTRDGAKVRRTYDAAATPYHRVLASGVLTKRATATLMAEYRRLNPAQLRRDIAVHQRRLLELTQSAIKTA